MWPLRAATRLLRTARQRQRAGRIPMAYGGGSMAGGNKRAPIPPFWRGDDDNALHRPRIAGAQAIWRGQIPILHSSARNAVGVGHSPPPSPISGKNRTIQLGGGIRWADLLYQRAIDLGDHIFSNLCASCACRALRGITLHNAPAYKRISAYNAPSHMRLYCAFAPRRAARCATLPAILRTFEKSAYTADCRESAPCAASSGRLAGG